MNKENIKEIVRDKYAQAAARAASGESSCCGTSPASSLDGCDPITSNLYGSSEASAIPEEALRASLGCGNPTALAKLQPGEIVLDLGSGGGIDVLLSAKRVGPTGKAYGLDMTDEMLALAEQNKLKSGLTNAEFLKGEIENIPLPNDTVDVIVSNCVINLSGDKDRVLREAFRVLKPAGRLAISDVVVRGRTRSSVLPFAVGLYITAAYWFTASTCFANPAVTIARCLRDTFAGIRPVDVPWFVLAQILGGFAATVVFRWLVPNLQDRAMDILLAHDVEQNRG